MTSAPTPSGFRQGLSFLGLAGFLAGFFGARVFATLNPTVVVVQDGIHFHHFWYGLALLVLSGWLGIVRRGDRLDRVYALIFGLGAGFVGDEVGLLLTFGNYYSQLTYVFVIGVIGFVSAVTLLLRYREKLEKDVLSIEIGERTVHIGLIVTGLSFLFFAYELWLGGIATLTFGIALVAAGRASERRRHKRIPHIGEVLSDK